MTSTDKLSRINKTKVKPAKISWLESGEPFSDQFQDYYFSTDGGLAETEYVFLKQNDFPQRFININKSSLTKNAPQDCVLRIAETGFGTGLNFLVTAYHWLQSADLHCTLKYTAIEKYPLSQSQIKQVYQVFYKSWPQLSFCCTELLTQYPKVFLPSEDGLCIHKFELFNGRIHLKLIIDDASAGLQQLVHSENKPSKNIDAWYLDGFAPAKNPDMWQTELFETMMKLSHTGTTLSTFTSAGIVRRGLIAAGFKITKIPGLGKKREILSGIKEADSE